MGVHIFSEDERKELLANTAVLRCGNNTITYNQEFKVKAIQQYENGVPCKEIFRQAGFNLAVIGRTTPKDCLKRWRRIVRKRGIAGLSTDLRGTATGGGGGRPRTKWDSDAERIKYLEAENAYLKAENDFLAKLRKAAGIR